MIFKRRTTAKVLAKMELVKELLRHEYFDDTDQGIEDKLRDLYAMFDPRGSRVVTWRNVERWQEFLEAIIESYSDVPYKFTELYAALKLISVSCDIPKELKKQGRIRRFFTMYGESYRLAYIGTGAFVPQVDYFAAQIWNQVLAWRLGV